MKLQRLMLKKLKGKCLASEKIRTFLNESNQSQSSLWTFFVRWWLSHACYIFVMFSFSRLLHSRKVFFLHQSQTSFWLFIVQTKVWDSFLSFKFYSSFLRLVRMMAFYLQIQENQRQFLRFAWRLRQVGKPSIPDEVVGREAFPQTKPSGETL